MTTVLESELIDDLGVARNLYPEWDALAVACRMPTMAPAWILGWWNHFAPIGALPRIVAIRDSGRLVGVAPFFVEPGASSRVDYRLPGIELAARLAPLALPDREWEVGEAIAGVLAQADPRPDLVALEALPVATHWRTALRDTWPGPVAPVSRCYAVHGCPTISLAGHTLDSWLSTKSANLRQQIRRARRKFEAAGGTQRFATSDALDSDVTTFMRLHTERWTSLGESNLARKPHQTTGLLQDAGRMLGEDRFRLIVLELDREPIGAYLTLAAGGELLWMNGGFDERRGSFSPFLLFLSYLIEDATLRGDHRIDLGLGEQPYKRRVADGNDPVGWTMLLTPGRRLPLTALQVAPVLSRYALRDAAKRALTEEQIAQVRNLRSRWRRTGGAAGQAPR